MCQRTVIQNSLTYIRSGTFVCFIVLVCVLVGFSSSHATKYRSEPPKQRRGCKPYAIKGKQYQPLSTHAGFVQGGTASWYGSDFHGRETSSGEAYNMHAMTAAHKTLPLGVYVKVQNKQNGREIVVRVNDRGPFVDGRIIDLSYSAAKNLGVVKSGTAPVQIEALGYIDRVLKGKPSYRAPLNYDSGAFVIQVGSCSSLENAQSMADEMRSQYVFTTIREAVVNGERYYRVHAGNYSSLKEAERVRKYSVNKWINAGYVVARD
jgi:rare lipoprotein A